MLRAEAPKPKLVPFSAWSPLWRALWHDLAAAMCMVCCAPRRGHPPCVVCTNAYGVTQLCRRCKTDPANAEWREAREESEEFIDALAPVVRLAELQDKKLRAATEFEYLVLDLTARGIWEERPYIDRRGRRRGTIRRRRRARSYEDVARAAGCTTQYVIDVLARWRR